MIQKKKFAGEVLLIACFLLLWFGQVAAQTIAEDPKISMPAPVTEKEGLRYNLNESGSLYFQATFLNQIWLRYNQSNPGTLVMGEPRSQTFDIGLRRTRIQLFGQVADRAFVYFQFGQNNFNALYNSSGNRKIAPFFHDALAEYRVTKSNALKFGAGLTVASGISRFTQPSVGTILTLDVPVFAQATVDQTDQFNRKLSAYARGQLGKLDYRLVLSDPFPVTSNGAPQPAPGRFATFAQQGLHKQYQAYLAYNLFEAEPHATPYMAGTYLGKRKVVSLGTGISYQRNALWSKPTPNDTLYHDMLLWSAEAFLDLPLNTEAGTAVSAYAGYFKYDFGPGYLRMNGIMNPANGSNASDQVSGAGPVFGNAVPMFGTGQIQYVQGAYLLPVRLLGEGNGQLQPFAAFTHSSFSRLGTGNKAGIIDVGANWLIKAHRAKLSVSVQNRPTFTQIQQGVIDTGPRKSSVIMQYQIFI